MTYPKKRRQQRKEDIFTRDGCSNIVEKRSSSRQSLKGQPHLLSLTKNSTPIDIQVPFPPDITAEDIVGKKRNRRSSSKFSNGFIIYRTQYMKELHRRNCKPPMTNLSQIVSPAWKREPKAVQRWYNQLAQEAGKLITKERRSSEYFYNWIVYTIDKELASVIPPVEQCSSTVQSDDQNPTVALPPGEIQIIQQKFCISESPDSEADAEVESIEVPDPPTQLTEPTELDVSNINFSVEPESSPLEQQQDCLPTQFAFEDDWFPASGGSFITTDSLHLNTDLVQLVPQTPYDNFPRGYFQQSVMSPGFIKEQSTFQFHDPTSNHHLFTGELFDPYDWQLGTYSSELISTVNSLSGL